MEKLNNFLNVDWLRNNYKKVHYFGLGFIQLKLNDNERLHFYTEKLIKTVNEEEIHDHRYNFVSTILKGTLAQQIYNIRYQGWGNNVDYEYYITQETCSEHNKIDFPKTNCNILEVYNKTYVKNDSYYLDHNTFHKVSSNDAITYVSRLNITKDYANVVYRKGQIITCPFSVKRPDDELFDIIAEMVN